MGRTPILQWVEFPRKKAESAWNDRAINLKVPGLHHTHCNPYVWSIHYFCKKLRWDILQFLCTFSAEMPVKKSLWSWPSWRALGQITAAQFVRSQCPEPESEMQKCQGFYVSIQSTQLWFNLIWPDLHIIGVKFWAKNVISVENYILQLWYTIMARNQKKVCHSTIIKHHFQRGVKTRDCEGKESPWWVHRNSKVDISAEHPLMWVRCEPFHNQKKGGPHYDHHAALKARGQNQRLGQKDHSVRVRNHYGRFIGIPKLISQRNSH